MLDKFYPSLATLIKSDDFPQSLGFLQNIADDVLRDFFYKELRIVTSSFGDRGTYEFKLLCYNRIEKEIFGTGLIFVINSDEISDEGSEFFLRFSYQIGILKYLQNFNIETFDWSNRAFFDLALVITEENRFLILKENIYVFIEDGETITEKIRIFINNYNINHPESQITVTEDSDENIYIQNVLDSLDLVDVSVYDVIYSDYIFDSNPIVLFNRIENLCLQFIGFFSIENLKKLLTPQLSLTIDNISLALAFPRTWLKPIDTNTGKSYENENIKSMLRFKVGTVRFTTENGLEFEGENEISFDKSEIGNTGITLFFDRMKLDLSRTRNIPEATAAGYPE